MKNRYLILIFPLVLLTLGVALVSYGSMRVPAPTFSGNLRGLLPSLPEGWTMREIPIADSPEMKEAVGELLNFDDGVFVNYLGPNGDRLSVYVAYWTPGKMSHRLIAGHTPDVCWVLTGWKRSSMERIDGSLLSPSAHKKATWRTSGADDPKSTGFLPLVQLQRVIPDGEGRTFVANGKTEYVWFWHLVGGQSKRYGGNLAPPWYAAITDMLQKGFNQREEQFFIRLSSNSPLADQVGDPMLSAVLSSLPWPTTDSKD